MSGLQCRLAAEIYGQSDHGCVRAENQDSVLIINHPAGHPYHSIGVLAMVADGMGGHAAGGQASRMAVEIIGSILSQCSNESSACANILSAMEHANAAIFSAANAQPDWKGMGTTLSLLWLLGNRAFVGHIGDTRIYQVQKDRLVRVTEDDTVIANLLKSSVISVEEALRHPDRSVLTKAMGTQAKVGFTVFELATPAVSGDQFLLCSDGLHDLVADNELYNVITSANALTACYQLIALARERGAHDNVSVVVVSLKSDGAGHINVCSTLPGT